MPRIELPDACANLCAKSMRAGALRCAAVDPGTRGAVEMRVVIVESTGVWVLVL